MVESPDVAGTGAVPFEDKPYGTVDNHGSSPFANRLYVTWTEFAPDGTAYIWEKYSADYGETFSDRHLVSVNGPYCTNTFGLPTPQGNCNEKNEGAAMGFVGSRVLEAGTVVGCVVSLLSVVSLRKAGAGAGAEVTAQSLVAFHDWIFLLGQGFIPAVNALLLGTLLYQSRLVPRVLPILGFIGASLLVISFLATLFGVRDQQSAVSALLTLPIAAWEFSLGVYLIVEGFKPSPITEGMRPGARPAYQDAVA